MKNLTKCKLAFVVAAAMGIVGCGSDGKDGEDGKPGTPPPVESSEVTNVIYIGHDIEDGQVTVQFEITDEDETPILGLADASLDVAVMTEKGIVKRKDGTEGGSAKASDEGASLVLLENGHYEFIAPISGVNADSDSLIRLQVGGGESEIATSPYVIIDKPDNAHTTSTEACYSCHVDYAESHLKHPSRTAIDIEGNADFVGGCMVCHGHVTRDDGGSNTHMQKIGHVNHQEFEAGFEISNCRTCHQEPITEVFRQETCIECHDAAGLLSVEVEATFNNLNDSGEDWRQFHTKVTELNAIRGEHSTTLSAIYKNDSDEYCTDLTLYKGEEILDIEALEADGTLSYASTYLHGYHDKSIVGRESRDYDVSYKGDGSKTMCHETLDLNTPQIMASSRVTFNLGEDASYDGVSFTSYSPVSELADLEQTTDYDRRHAVTADSCTTCHNNGANFHKNGSFHEGGLDCVACHNNGQDRAGSRVVTSSDFVSDEERIKAGYVIPYGEDWKAKSAPGFGPLVHKMHWGSEQTITGSELNDKGEEDILTNSALSLNADNCVSCHADGIDLAAIPNQYIRAKSLNTKVNEDGEIESDSTKMASPITANCYSCHEHNSDSALNHMKQNGGEIDAEVLADWYTQETSESCATCHDTGKSMGIDKFHNFER
ncbi:hypothetical protein L2735_17760 [Shewanella olleyana]|uniref:multiheme c-type cytochrome n=1 Tax=Shewanella olleyana TaxID=135626 RepID=UPI00200F3554|nr:hypothetical protein [Shewanella olleyana]MCL1068620.1 hypothetical protein [Shewanella olleyana]